MDDKIMTLKEWIEEQEKSSLTMSFNKMAVITFLKVHCEFFEQRDVYNSKHKDYSKKPFTPKIWDTIIEKSEFNNFEEISELLEYGERFDINTNVKIEKGSFKIEVFLDFYQKIKKEFQSVKNSWESKSELPDNFPRINTLEDSFYVVIRMECLEFIFKEEIKNCFLTKNNSEAIMKKYEYLKKYGDLTEDFFAKMAFNDFLKKMDNFMSVVNNQSLLENVQESKKSKTYKI